MTTKLLLTLPMLAALPLAAQQTVVLAIGGHAGDMEVSAGAALARASRMGAKVVLLHLTLGENGHPRTSAADYAKQKREEAELAAKALGGEARFGLWTDASLRAGKETEEFVAQVIKDVKATHIITHWKNSIHPDHEAAYVIANHAALLAAVSGWKGVRSIVYAENWEDPEGFQPYLFVDTTADMDAWRKAVQCYEFLRGGVSAFPYLQFYEGLSMVRGAQARKRNAVAFDIDPMGKRRVAEVWP
ncbi:MAG TPA: PIG-L family deacetylase [Bryobacteraceae bacterium]|nr:PIG-L family deacetylase [Bryobacteraceae bacterium]